MYYLLPNDITNIINQYVDTIYFHLDLYSNETIISLLTEKNINIEPYPLYIEHIPHIFYPYIKTIWLQKDEKYDIRQFKYFFPSIKNIFYLPKYGDELIKFNAIQTISKKCKTILTIDIDNSFKNYSHFYDINNHNYFDLEYNYIYINENKNKKCISTNNFCNIEKSVYCVRFIFEEKKFDIIKNILLELPYHIDTLCLETRINKNELCMFKDFLKWFLSYASISSLFFATCTKTFSVLS